MQSGSRGRGAGRGLGPDGGPPDGVLHDDFGRALAPTTASDTIGAVRDLLDTFGTGVDDGIAVLAVHVPRPTREEQRWPNSRPAR
ncbi:hypothetical protein [Streptomyces sp. NPDC017202]|uniref:hypothetical protein n=1 Tax=Streptomyces sp. NPDC017202 TaxID=3364981 RepID=UPI003787A415